MQVVPGGQVFICHSIIIPSSIFMTTASELENIRSNPIKEGLNTFRYLCQSKCTDLNTNVPSDAVQIAFSTAAVQA